MAENFIKSGMVVLTWGILQAAAFADKEKAPHDGGALQKERGRRYFAALAGASFSFTSVAPLPMRLRR